MEKYKRFFLLVYKKNLNEDIDKLLTSNSDIKKYAYALHNISDYIHYHIYLDFVDKSFETKDIAKLFNIPEVYIQPVDILESDVLQYLVNLPQAKVFPNFVNL